MSHGGIQDMSLIKLAMDKCTCSSKQAKTNIASQRYFEIMNELKIRICVVFVFRLLYNCPATIAYDMLCIVL